MNYGKSRLFALAAAHGAALLAVPAVLQAQQVAGQLEEVVVTARQREENIQDVPVTITAFTATEIRNAGITRPQDFIALTPGVSVVNTAEAGDMQVSIRGINTGRDVEPNFALVVDGVLQTNPNALNQELWNVTQIEVLKGPQGALYGRNAVAGAIIVTTRKPGEELEAEVRAGYGTQNSYDAGLYVGGPIGGTVRGSFGAYTRSTDGFYDNTFLTCDDCVDTFSEDGFLGRLLFDVGGGEMDFKAKYSQISSGAINFNASLALVDAAAFLNTPSFYPNPNNQKFVYINNIKPKNEQENLNLSLRGDWDLSFATLSGYVAYNDQQNYFLTDGTSAAFQLYGLNPTCQASNDALRTVQPLPSPFFYVPSNLWYQPGPGQLGSFLPPYSPTTCDGYQYQERNQSDTSIEVRLTSPGDEALRWVGGLYYAYIDRDVVVSQGSDLNQGLSARAFVPTSGRNPTDLLYDDTFDTNVYSIFGQLAYDVVENVELALALRYDTEQRDVNNNVKTCNSSTPTGCRAQTPLFNFGSNPYINPAYTATPSYATNGIPDRSKTFSELQPKLSANWAVNEEVSLFASYGFGFRSGGFNSSGSEATINQYFGNLFYSPGVPNISDVKDDYKSETSEAAEIGMKSILLDRHLQVNLAAFYTTVEDLQFFNFFVGPFGLLRVVTNIDEVTIQGVEADFHWNVTDSVSVYGGYSYIDSNIDQYNGRPYTKGNKVPYAPDYTGNLGVEWLYPMTSSLKLLARLDATFVGETWFSPVQDETLPNLFTGFGFGEGNFARQKRDAYSTLNLRLGVESENWTATAWGRNVADEAYLQEIIPAPEFGGSFIHQSPGDSYGVEVTYKF
jgi:iron complex outermembrane receptor protein